MGFLSGALEIKSLDFGEEHVTGDCVNQRDRKARRLRSKVKERICHLHRALGSPWARSEVDWGPDLQRSCGQRFWLRRVARDRESIYKNQTATVDSVSLGHCRRKGIARREVLRQPSALSAETNAGGYQYGCAERLGPNARCRSSRSRTIDPGGYVERHGAPAEPGR